MSTVKILTELYVEAQKRHADVFQVLRSGVDVAEARGYKNGVKAALEAVSKP